MNRGKGLFLICMAACFALIAQAGDSISILCTTFPVYQLTRNLAEGREGIRVSQLLPPDLGCPHDYSLAPLDMQKISAADVLVINGQGMEEFLGSPALDGHYRAKVIDSSRGITEFLRDEDEADASPAGNGHLHEGVNPHFFSSPRLYGQMARSVAEQLSALDPKGAAIYARNAQAYQAKMDQLAGEMEELGARLQNRRSVTQHGAFDYLARDMGLEVAAVVQAHPGQEPSAADMLAIIRTIREKGAGGIFTEPQYPSTMAETIAREAGVPVAVLDPAATGPANAGLDYYEMIMRRNMTALSNILGSKK